MEAGSRLGAPSLPQSRCPADMPGEVAWGTGTGGGQGGRWTSRTKRQAQSPLAQPTRVACLLSATCGGRRGVGSEGSRLGSACGVPAGRAHRGLQALGWEEVPASLSLARHCTNQTRAQGAAPLLHQEKEDVEFSLLTVRPPSSRGGRCVCVRVRVSTHTYVKSTAGQAGQDHAWLVLAVGGAALARPRWQAAEAPWSSGAAGPVRPPQPPGGPSPQAPGPGEGVKVGLVEKDFFFFFFLLFKNPVVLLTHYCPATGSPGPSGGSARPRVASNLWYCMFWAGKRGRRSSAGSLESNVEVSRKPPSSWLSCVASWCLSVLLLLPFCTEAQTPRLPHPCMPPAWRSRAPHRLSGVQRRGWVWVSWFSLRLTHPRGPSMVHFPASRSSRAGGGGRRAPSPAPRWRVLPPRDFRAPPSPSLPS